MSITKDTLENVFERRFTDAKENWKGSCPFHDERTPSFFIHKDLLIANCFGCGVSGYIDTLAARYRGYSKVKAREALQLSSEEIIRSRSGKKQNTREAPKTFPKSWLAPFKKEIHKYVIDRGFDIEVLKDAGTLYDSNTKRQVFPHYNRKEELLGCIGRACIGQEPKWHFYWNYDRGKCLYSPFKVHGSNRSPVLVVEGVFDLLWLKQHGYEAVATLGTKFTQTQIQELREFDSVILAFDRDHNYSGQWAEGRLYRQLKKACKISFLDYPEHIKDVNEMSKEQLDETISNPITYVQRQSIQNPNPERRTFVQQKKGFAGVGTGMR